MCGYVTSGPLATSNISPRGERERRGEGAHWLSARSPSSYSVGAFFLSCNLIDVICNPWLIIGNERMKSLYETIQAQRSPT